MKASILIQLLLAASIYGASAEIKPEARETIEWCDVWIANANQTGSPRVLLIGDSIARGYYPQVEKRLAGKAFVARLTTSAFLTDPMLDQQLAMVLGSMKFDVIHFNNGLHGWQHSEADYRKAFPDFVATIQKHAPDAKLIWAATTPFKSSTNAASADLNRENNERVVSRNNIALSHVKSKHIPVNDLFSLMKDRIELYSDTLHFKREGIELQAEQVAAKIESLLPR